MAGTVMLMVAPQRSGTRGDPPWAVRDLAGPLGVPGGHLGECIREGEGAVVGGRGVRARCRGVAGLQRREALRERDEAVALPQPTCSVSPSRSAAAVQGTNPAIAVALAAESRPRDAKAITKATTTLITSRLTLGRAAAQQVGESMTGHTNSVMSVAFSPDGQLLDTAKVDDTVRLWDPVTGQQVGEPLTCHTN